MRRLLAFVVCALAALCLFPAQATASTLTDCLADHVCVTSSGRSLISDGQQARLERQIGSGDIYLVVAPSGSSGYNTAMNQIVGDLGGHARFTVGFVDSRLMHFGADSRGMLPSRAAADIATRAVAGASGGPECLRRADGFRG